MWCVLAVMGVDICFTGVHVVMHAGLKVLVADGKVFECHDALDEAMYYSDVGSSLAILDAGYTLHSFMVRIQPLCSNVSQLVTQAKTSPVFHFIASL